MSATLPVRPLFTMRARYGQTVTVGTVDGEDRVWPPPC